MLQYHPQTSKFRESRIPRYFFLKVLEAEGMVIRTYGGAFIQDGVENLVDANIRSGAYVENKRIIAERSRQFVHEGDTIF